MRHEDEIQRGIDYFKGIIESGKVLRLSEPQILGQFNFWYRFVVTGYSKQWDFTLSRDELSDIPGTRQYQVSAVAFAEDLKKRFKNVSPSLFLCVSGRLIDINVEWPHQPWAGRTASYVPVRVVDKLTNEFAYCFVAQSHQQDMFELKEDPFREYPGITNSIRKAVDSRSITFYPSPADHPDDLQLVKLALSPTQPPVMQAGSFLKQKVLSMGFRSGGRDTEVWIADTWDAYYLGVPVQSFQMEAEYLEAEEFVRINDEDRSFASAAKKLLLEERSRNAGASMGTGRPAPSGDRRDVFLSHASEDKPFVRELAAELQKRNISCWFDESEITLGDSLRRAIDDGLRTSRYGVVVLSERFFAKEWPQRELDGILALEIDRKVLLPIWHHIGAQEILRYSPMLAGRYAAQSSEGASAVADKIVAAMRDREV